MKFKVWFPLLLSILTGIMLSFFVLSQYDKDNIKPVVGTNKRTVNFLQYGVYSNEENMKKNTKNLSYYMYSKVGDKYHVYTCISGNSENVLKIKGYWSSAGYNLYSKEITVNSEAFLMSLDQYDELMKNADSKTIPAICNQIIAKYEELNLNVNN